VSDPCRGRGSLTVTPRIADSARRNRTRTAIV